MEYRRLGASGLRVPALSFGTATFGGSGDFFKAWGSTDANGASRLIDICLDHGVSMFDSADVYSDGLAETILGEAIKGKRDRLLISTKVTFPTGDGPNDYGSSRKHLINAVEASLKRLGANHIDLLQLHGQDYNTPVEETLSTLDQLVREGKIRYIGASNFSGWHLMKSQAVSDRYGYARHVSHQVYYSLLNRDYEWELMPLGRDQGIGATIWSPLGWGKLTGKIRRGQPAQPGTRAHDIAGTGPAYPEERLFAIVDVLDDLAEETGKTIPQIALNWLLRKPTVANVIIGARNEEQLVSNIGAVGWALSAEQVARLDIASETPSSYPVWHQRSFPMLNEHSQGEESS
ncbi:aldo/keto reductase [Sphingobium bisphenolivorans]|uniref:aldo/keto reductase n=1 Tax=Sphingobium bisphenolivorans TaxID=1335760 RepID=UPI0003A3939F|nr:aldo/keto reductase [Sphingobium bisphenolivorans]